MARKRFYIDKTMRDLLAGLPRRTPVRRAPDGRPIISAATYFHDLDLPAGGVYVEFDPLKPRPTGPIPIMQADGRPDWPLTGRTKGEIEWLSPLARGSWLLLDFDIVRGPDRRYWTPIARVVHNEDATHDGDGMPVGPTDGTEQCARFWNSHWVLALDENGDAIS